MELDEENNPVVGERRIIPPQLQEHYEKKLLDLQQNETKHFTISEYVDDGGYPPVELDESDFTIEQWNCLFTELKKNSSVDIVTVELRCCPVECLVHFVDYIGTSRTLKDLIIKYVSFVGYYQNGNEELPSEIPENYRVAIDDILRAARQNPSIQNLHLHCLGNPQSMEDLLAGNDSLKKFELSMYKYDNTSKAMARSIAAGFKGNNTLREIGLSVDTPGDYPYHKGWGRLDIMISGLCHPGDDSSSNLESLSLSHQHPYTMPKLDARILEAIRCTPSLKTLVLAGADDDWYPGDEAYSVSVLKNLRGPEYAGLKTLELRGVTLGTSRRNFEKGTIFASSNRILPDDQVNMTLERLDLAYGTYYHQNAMALLWELRGLRQLNLNAYVNSQRIEDEDDDSTGNTPDYWAESFRCCTQLCQVSIHLSKHDHQPDDEFSGIFASILNGARGHNALEYMKLSADVRGRAAVIPEGRLPLLVQQLLRETPSLKHLSIMNVGPQDDLATGLARGLRENKSLEKLDLKMMHMLPSNFRTIIESLFDNRTLKHVGHDSSYLLDGNMYKSKKSREICETLARLFRVNASLHHFALPLLDLRGQNMHALLEGWRGNNATLQSLDMMYCQTDDAGLCLLGQALATTLQLEHILLPRLGSFDSAAFKDFLGSIAQMRHVKALDFDLGSSFRGGDDYRKECFKLLLNAAQKNKFILSFGQSLPTAYRNEPLVSEIEYYLKLNRYGRHILDITPNQSLWPAILVRIMANKPEDTDVLFFFIREYFMRNSYPLRRQQQQQHVRQIPPPPPPKRARVLVGESAGEKGERSSSSTT